MRNAYLAVAVVCFAFIGTAQATIHVVSLGTNAPPPKLGGFSVTPFAADPVADGTVVSTGPGPNGHNLSFNPSMAKYTAQGSWNNWSNGYAGTVYFEDGTTETVTLPGLTRAFYLYSEGNDFATINITVTSDSGATLTQSVTTPNGAEGFGIFTDAEDTIATVTIDAPTAAAGFAIGEFGIFVGAGVGPPVAVPTLSQSTLLLLALLLLGCGVYVQRRRNSR